MHTGKPFTYQRDAKCKYMLREFPTIRNFFFFLRERERDVCKNIFISTLLKHLILKCFPIFFKKLETN